MDTKQAFKSIYFPDLRAKGVGSKSFTLAFSENDEEIFKSIRHLSSHELRRIIGTSTFRELRKKAEASDALPNKYCLSKLRDTFKTPNLFQNSVLDPAHVTFKGGKELPLQNWYPYLEGYSPDFVKHIIDRYVEPGAKVVYDPFSGSGTTPVVASELGYVAYYSEVNPFLQFLTKVKAKARNVEKRKKIIDLIEVTIPRLETEIMQSVEDQDLHKAYSATFGESKFFSSHVFSQILKTRTYINQLYFKDVLLSELLTVAVLASLIENSYLIRRGDLRFRRGKELDELQSANYFQSLKDKLRKIIDDLYVVGPSEVPSLVTEDARTIGELPFLGIDAVITSPPYLNGTNYFRNTKLELWFLGYLKSKEDLSNFRKLAVTAGINDVSLTTQKSIKNRQIQTLIKTLSEKAYDKRIPKMVHDYFSDMDTIFRNLKTQLNKGAVLAIDLGDSVYGGIHVKTDDILISILQNIGYDFVEKKILRKRQSNNGQELKQVLLVFKNPNRTSSTMRSVQWQRAWQNFKDNMPHHSGEMAKRNWGDAVHSLCSYQGKLKPSIAHQLTKIFVPDGGKVLDIFGGVGTIPLEAGLQNKLSFSFDISPTAVAISRAKLGVPSLRKVEQTLQSLQDYLTKEKISGKEINAAGGFGLNKHLVDYFHPQTFKEILLARKFFSEIGFDTTEKALVMSSLMHILHGNRPYALSRRSHGITPFAPTGEFEYKSLMEKLREKVLRTLNNLDRQDFRPGNIYFQDATKTWPAEVRDLSAIITSPPFFDSTRFYAANWMRLWFAGWDDAHFKTEPVNFVDELQKKDLSVYDNIFMQARERLTKGGVFVLHLGKNSKCDMAKELAERAVRWFRVYDIFEENVEDAESHGIKDRGSTTRHQYLILH